VLWLEYYIHEKIPESFTIFAFSTAIEYTPVLVTFLVIISSIVGD